MSILLSIVAYAAGALTAGAFIDWWMNRGDCYLCWECEESVIRDRRPLPRTPLYLLCARCRMRLGHEKKNPR